MRNHLLKLAVISVFSLSTTAFATGLESLPAAGFTVTAGTNQAAGTTGWRECNTTGLYGSLDYDAPTATTDNTCAVFPSGGNDPGTPVSGFTNVTLSTAKRSVTITANGETLATMRQRVYRNSAATECVFEKRFVMATTGSFDYNPDLTGSQRLEVNDFVLGGFSGTTDVSAGYYHSANTDSPVFRMGRSFTSVQIQGNDFDAATALNTGYVRRPVNSPAPASGTEINGVGQTLVSPGTPTAAQQTAEIRTNWVDFTVDVTGGVDEDGTTAKDSPFLYVRAGCGSGTEATAFPTTNNTVRIRQTGQESQPWVTVVTNGVTRSGANANF
ncbi:hypothetical protein [Methylophilus sp. YYY-1]|uniref:hypothetical protein n=1 Tax=unclassified Methylophilus TaxID=2630143 RepID=UPI0023B2A509|nr:hypothetical protein [Methylophilus sp. YYY-1]MDF0377570.1 hypothetical protein [Methylophilus sp. YYY-1]